MPTWRKLHTKTTESISVNDMPDDFTRLLWVLLPLILDREGRGIDNPSWIRGHVMPLRTDVDNDRISEAMQYFVSQGMIERYTSENKPYFCIPTFRLYQGNCEREAPSHLPPPPNKVKSKSRVSHDKVKPRGEENRREESREEQIPDDGGASDFSKLVKVYENNINMITPIMAEELKEALQEYKLEWCEQAITETVKAGVRSWNYAAAILKRWKKDGKNNGHKGKASKDDERHLPQILN